MLMADSTKIILASGSRARRTMLEHAGVQFEVEVSSVDEDAVRTALEDVDPIDVAEVLARAKVEDVARRSVADIVIGADQVLEFEGRVLTKPADMAAARAQLLQLKGKRHQLHSAVAIAAEDTVSWVHVNTVDVTLRDYSPAFVGRYLSAVGDDALSSVGCYQIEGQGVQLIGAISGDYFTVLGMPLLPVLAELRRLGALTT